MKDFAFRKIACLYETNYYYFPCILFCLHKGNQEGYEGGGFLGYTMGQKQATLFFYVQN